MANDDRGQRWVNFVGAAGEYRVASILSQRGYIPSVPLVDEGYDFFVFDPVNDSFKKVQAKASRAKSGDVAVTKTPKKHDGQDWAGREYWKHQVTIRRSLLDNDVPGLIFLFFLFDPTCDDAKTITIVISQQDLRALAEKEAGRTRKTKANTGEVGDGEDQEKREADPAKPRVLSNVYNIQLRVFYGENLRVNLNGAKPTQPDLAAYIGIKGIDALFPQLDLDNVKVEAANPPQAAVPEDESETTGDEDDEEVMG